MGDLVYFDWKVGCQVFRAFAKHVAEGDVGAILNRSWCCEMLWHMTCKTHNSTCHVRFRGVLNFYRPYQSYRLHRLNCLNAGNFYPHPGSGTLYSWVLIRDKVTYPFNSSAPSHKFFPFYLASENSPTIMCAWKTRKTVTFPATSSYSPATNQAPVHRVDGRTRTDNILEGDTQSINANADGPDFENEKAKQPIRGTHSSISTQAVIHESAIDCSEKSRAVSSVMKSPTTVAIKIYQRGPQPLPATRQRILFYHKNDPYYGFTNFSPHSVIYKDKEYPTSEHLFQSFKVYHFFCIYKSNTYGPSRSSKTIIPIWQSTSEYTLKSQALLSRKHADTSMRCGQTGSK